MEGPVSDEHPENCGIVIPPQVHITSDMLIQLPNPLPDDGKFGIRLYLTVLDILH